MSGEDKAPAVRMTAQSRGDAPASRPTAITGNGSDGGYDGAGPWRGRPTPSAAVAKDIRADEWDHDLFTAATALSHNRHLHRSRPVGRDAGTAQGG